MSKQHQVSGITVSFTKDELEWLDWVMTAVLGKATHVPPHVAVSKKISQAVQLIHDINTTMEGRYDPTGPTHPSGVASS